MTRMAILLIITFNTKKRFGMITDKLSRGWRLSIVLLFFSLLSCRQDKFSPIPGPYPKQLVFSEENIHSGLEGGHYEVSTNVPIDFAFFMERKTKDHAAYKIEWHSSDGEQFGYDDISIRITGEKIEIDITPSDTTNEWGLNALASKGLESTYEGYLIIKQDSN